MNKKTLMSVVILYFLSTASSYAAFSFLNQGSKTPTLAKPGDEMVGGLLKIDAGEPRDQECPLNGQLFTKTEKDAWDVRRPLAIMVENSPDARPHSGIIRADVVYEAVAEGGVTRFMPIYYCDAQRDNVTVAPARSVRTYFIDWASEYGETPLFAHVGGANCSGDKLEGGGQGPCKTDKKAQAIEQLADYGWRYSTGNDLDQFSVGAPKKYPNKPTYVRNETRLGRPVATEHSVETYTELLWQVGIERGWTNLDPDGVAWTKNFTPWKFQDDAKQPERGSVKQISFEFWEGFGEYAVKWDYDLSTNEYKRSTAGSPHKDLETDKQIASKNVVVLFTKEMTSVDELKHTLYTTIGNGDAVIFQNGQAIEATWSKAKRVGRTIFKDKKGKEISFVRGPIWIHVLAIDSKVTY